MPDSLEQSVAMLAQALLHFLWQGVLIGLLAAIALRPARHARPQIRYGIACAALLACIAAPLLTLAMPHAPRYAEGPIVFALNPDLGRWLVGFWAVGMLVMCSRLALGLAWIERLRARTQLTATAEWQARLATLATRFGMRRKIMLRIVDYPGSPFTAGWWRPVILLPAALLTSMPVNMIEALLAHELAHIQRHDYLVNLLQKVIEAVLFYHPVIWWLSRRIRMERELVADDIAADMLGTPRPLVRALVALAEHERGFAMELAQSASGGALMQRIEALAGVRQGRPARPAMARALALALVAGCLACYAGTQTLLGQTAPASSPRQLVPNKVYSVVILSGDSEPSLYWGPETLKEEIVRHRRAGRPAIWAHIDREKYLVTDTRLVAQAVQAWRQSKLLVLEINALASQQQRAGSPAQAASLRIEQEKAANQAVLRTHTLVSEAAALGLATRVQ